MSELSLKRHFFTHLWRVSGSSMKSFRTIHKEFQTEIVPQHDKLLCSFSCSELTSGLRDQSLVKCQTTAISVDWTSGAWWQKKQRRKRMNWIQIIKSLLCIQPWYCLTQLHKERLFLSCVKVSCILHWHLLANLGLHIYCRLSCLPERLDGWTAPAPPWYCLPQRIAATNCTTEW